jgi:hypothetical protein
VLGFCWPLKKRMIVPSGRGDSRIDLFAFV